MKKIKTISIVAAALTLLCGTVARAQEDNTELMYDGGFENYSYNMYNGTDTRWKPYHSYSVAFAEVITKDKFPNGVYEGDKAVRFTNIKGEVGRGLYYQNSEKLIEGCKIGDIYEFTGYFKTDASSDVQLFFVNGYARLGTEIYEGYPTVNLTNEWQKITQRFVITEENQSFNLRIVTDLTTSLESVSYEATDISFVYADSLSFKKVGSLTKNETARLILKKYYMENVANGSNTAAENYVKSQNEDGTWSDINYSATLTDRTSTALPHLQRVRLIAESMLRYDKYLFNNKDVAIDAIERGIKAWYDKIGYPLKTDGNLIHGTSWWYDTIGQQLNHIAPILAYTDGYLSEETKNILVGYLYDYKDMKNYPGFLTGANLVWYCQNGIVRGIMTGDDNLIDDNYNRMMQEWKMTKYSWQEGVQSDYSFHQHLQNYQPGYGTNYLLNSSKISVILKQSGYIGDEDYTLLSNLMTEGISWLYRGKYMWPMLCGREITKEAYVNSNSADVYNSAKNIAKLDSRFESGLSSLADYIENNKIDEAYRTGNKYFNCSDFMVHARDSWSAAVRMISNRTVASESSNTQNFWGQYSGAGEYAMTKSGDIQNEAYLYYDRTRLPGATLPDTLEKTTFAGTFVSQIDGFAGGVSDGEYGAATMQQSRWNIKANKSWFYFDDEYVCLGSGITSTRNNVATTVDTRILKDSLKVDGTEITGDTETNSTKSVFSNNIGYYFPSGEGLSISNGEMSKSWGELNNSGDTALETAQVMSIVIPHKSPVRNDKYEYIVLPDIDESGFSEYMQNCPIDIAENSENIQAVSHSKGIYYASFIKPGEVTFSDGLTLKADKGAMVMLRCSSEGSYSLSVSTPYKQVKKVSVTVLKDGKKSTLSFDMPYNSDYSEMLGSTVTKNFEL